MKQEIKNYIKKWEGRCYSLGIPDEIPQNLADTCRVPNYKTIAKAILKNDKSLELLGMTRKKCEAYNHLKRIELSERGVIKPNYQLKLL